MVGATVFGEKGEERFVAPLTQIFERQSSLICIRGFSEFSDYKFTKIFDPDL